MSEYKVKGLKPNGTVTTISRKGKDIKVHRPVLANGFRANRGWQFSHDGVPISTIAPPLVRTDMRQEAIDVFDELMALLGNGWDYKFAEVKRKNADLFKAA